jgi:MFS family permease
VLPRVADIKGRKPMFLLGLVFYVATVAGMLIATNKWVLYGLVILGGISETGRYYVAYVYVVEIFPKRLQSFAGLCIFMTFACAKVTVCLYFVLSNSRDWVYLGYTAIALAIISFLMTSLLVSESPRWLASKNRIVEAENILAKISQSNLKTSKVNFVLKSHEEEEASIPLGELLKNKVYRNNLLVMMVIWSFGSFSFFLVPYYL